MTRNVLILGASGRFGRNAAMAFDKAGWLVRTFDRRKDDLLEKAQGCDVIVAAWNPPYPDWAAQVPDLHRRIIRAAKATGATVILPGNLYVYGKESPRVLRADTRHGAQNSLGKIRIAMEREYRESGVSVLCLRAGDYIDTDTSGNWFDLILVKSLAKGILTYPGRSDTPHAWAYLPDVARAAVRLVARGNRPDGFEDILFPGYTMSGQEMAARLEAIGGKPVQVRQMSWLPIQIAAPFWKMGRCLAEMRYLWSMPHQLDHERFEALLPDFVPTPVDEALTRAVAHIWA